METSLLSTKLNIPPLRPQLVTRPRLMERLKEGLNYNLILVSAPAGFGKTTLLSEWVRQNRQQSTAWLSLDEGDSDPTRFWDYFINALRSIQPAFGEKILPLLHSPQPPSTEPMLTELINDISTISGDFILVLDDYHLIESQQIHDGIIYLLEHIPSHMHVVIASRANPPLPLARFRVRGMMLEIRADELRFTLEDVAGLLRELRAPELSAEDVAALNERTEGWVAGLKMAAMSIKDQKDIPGFIAAFTGSQRYVMDYLLEEVLQRQTEETRDFLMKTSILERLSGPLCDAVTGRKGSQDILLNFERGHLFIVPLDESRQWYRYEHLFVDILRHQLEKTYDLEDVARLHQRASQWYEGNILPDEAIHHALTARDWKRATMLIDEHASKKIGSGEMATLFNWTQQLPEEVLLSHPLLYIYHMTAMWPFVQIETAESMLKTLEKATEGDDSIKSYIAAQQVHLALKRHDYALVGELAEKALSLLPPDELWNRAVLSNYLGWVYYMRGSYIEAELLFTKGREAARQTGQHYLASGVFGGLMIIIWRKGKLQRVAEMAQQAIEQAGLSPVSAIPHIVLSFILYEWNDLDGATDHIQQVVELGELAGTIDRAWQTRFDINTTLARIRLTQGNETGFLEAMEKADVAAQEIGDMPRLKTFQAASHIEFALRQDDLVTAGKWGIRFEEYSHALSHEYLHIPLRLLIAQGRKSEALKKLQVLYDEAVKSGMHGLMIEYRVYQALAAETEVSALEYLSEALTLAEPEGYIRTFVDEGKLLKPLLEKALSKGITPEYTCKLITIIEAEERQKLKRKKGEGAASPYQALLSERELEILRLIAADVSNQQIADSLTISLSTVKTHVHHILEKLNAKDRSQAVFYARELELI